MRKTNKQKLDETAVHSHIAEAPPGWVGGQLGKTMIIPNAWELDELIRNIPNGQTMTIKALREVYARKHHVDITCPLTTGIFIRLLAEFAEEQRAGGNTDITPYWQIVGDNGKLPPKIEAIYNRRLISN